MPITQNPITVDNAFFEPLTGLATASPHNRSCPDFSDEDCVRLGVQRVLEMSESGRGFLQEHGLRFENTPGHSNYFAALNSQRRCDVIGDVNLALVTLANAILHDRLAGIPELANYECFAQDGHWHKAAAHDPRHEGSKMAAGHFYSLNLRRHSLRHLAVGYGLHEHDMSALKRVNPRGLRQGVPKGTRVLIVYDKAAIDYSFWKRCRQECAVYFISRVKENMVFDWIESVSVEGKDPRNHGVTEDRRVRTRDGHLLRIVYYTDPQSAEEYEFLTNEPDLPPGVVVELYRRRWEAEKGNCSGRFGSLRKEGTAIESVAQMLEHGEAVFADSRDIASNANVATCAFQSAKAAGDLQTGFHHPECALGFVVGKGQVHFPEEG